MIMTHHQAPNRPMAFPRRCQSPRRPPPHQPPMRPPAAANCVPVLDEGFDLFAGDRNALLR
jgi:hypothetical protein